MENFINKRKTKILIIDDKTVNLILLHDFIDEMLSGCEIFTALNGKEGLKLAFINDPDVILLDIMMPDMDGFEVCKTLKANVKMSDIPIVFLTAANDVKKTRLEGLECGAEAFLTKPIDESELLAQMRAMLKIRTANLEKRNENERLAALVAERTQELELELLERIAAEEKLKQSEEKYRLIADYVDDWVYWVEPNGYLRYVSPSCERITGYSISEFSTHQNLIKAIVFDEDKNKVNLHSQIIAHENPPSKLEFRIITKSGELRWVHHSCGPIFTNEGIYAGRRVTNRNITERKLAEEKIRKIGQHYQALIDKAPDGIVLIDEKGEFMYTSPSAKKMFGYKSTDNAVGSPANFTHPEDLPMLLSEFTKLFVDPSYTPTLQYRFCDINGNFKWVESTFSNLLSDPSVEAIVINFRDISERKLAENEIQKLNTELELRVQQRTSQLVAANKELEAFTYSVSHDLRAPLRAVDGFSRFFLEDYEDKLDQEAIRLINVIRTNTTKMDQLITDLLSLSKITRNEIMLWPVDMNVLVASVIKETVDSQTASEFTFQIHDLPLAQGDYSLLKQVWINLISNAIKYTRKQEVRKIEIGSYNADGYLCFFIKDTGVGFDQEYGHKLFTAFQRLHASDQYEGNGIGLAIVQRIIHKHGGKVWAESQINEGATFGFGLPQSLE